MTRAFIWYIAYIGYSLPGCLTSAVKKEKKACGNRYTRSSAELEQSRKIVEEEVTVSVQLEEQEKTSLP